MSISTEINRLQQAKSDIKSAIENKGVLVPSNAKLDTYDDYISQISGGGGSGGYAITSTSNPDGTQNLAITNDVSGTINITENGTYDVMNFANAFVNVSGGGGGAVLFEEASPNPDDATCIATTTDFSNCSCVFIMTTEPNIQNPFINYVLLDYEIGTHTFAYGFMERLTVTDNYVNSYEIYVETEPRYEFFPGATYLICGCGSRED